MISKPKDFHTYIVVLTVYILSWIVGATIGWSSPMISKLQSNQTDDNPLGRLITDEEASWITSALTLGLIFGALVFGKLPDFIGRKIAMLLLGVPATLSAAMLTFIPNIYVYIIARLLQGVVLGGFSSVLPLYIGELCHSSKRGFFTAGAMLISRFGIMYSYAVGAYVPIFPYNISLFIFSLVFVPSFYFIAPETPYYLLRKEQDIPATDILEKLRGYSGTALEKELDDVRQNVKENQEESIIHVFKNKAARIAFVISTALASLEHLIGVNCILFYAETFIKNAGTNISSELCPIIISGVQIIVGLVAPLTCDKIGRKLLLHISAIGVCVPMIVLGTYFYFKDHEGTDVNYLKWLPPVCLFIAVGFFEVGWSSQPLVVMGEIFPMNVKCIGSTCAISSSAVVAFLISKYFNAAASKLGMYSVLWFFAATCLLAILFVFHVVEETKGKTLNEIQNVLKKDSNNV